MKTHEKMNETNLEMLIISNLIKELNKKDSFNSAASSIQQHICIICDNVFAKENNLIRHIEKSHENLRKYYCKMCTRKFKRDYHLRKHEIVHFRNIDVVYDRVFKNREVSMSVIESYLQYLTNSTIQDVFHRFIIIYDKIFSRTFCSYCEKLKVEIEVKWNNFDFFNDYTLWIWLSISLHTKKLKNDQIEIALCEKCTKNSKTSSISNFWSEELLCLKQWSRSFLSSIVLNTNLEKTTNANDNLNSHYTYRTFTNRWMIVSWIFI